MNTNNTHVNPAGRVVNTVAQSLCEGLIAFVRATPRKGPTNVRVDYGNGMSDASYITSCDTTGEFLRCLAEFLPEFMDVTVNGHNVRKLLEAFPHDTPIYT